MSSRVERTRHVQNAEFDELTVLLIALPSCGSTSYPPCVPLLVGGAGITMWSQISLEQP